MPLLRQIVHNSATFLLIAVSKTAVLPLLALAMPPAEFGVYALVTAAYTFGIGVLGLNVNAYVSRAVPGMATGEARQLVGTTALFEALVGAGVLVMVFGTGAISAVLETLKVGGRLGTFAIAAVWLVIELFNVNLRNYLYGRNEVARANVMELLRQVGWVPLALLYWSLMRYISVDVVLLASVLGSLIAAAYALAVVRPHFSLRVDRPLLLVATRFAVPLIVPGVMLVALRLADRSVLSATRSLEEVAGYALVVGVISGLYSFTALSIEMVLLPRAVRAMNLGDARAGTSLLLVTTTYGCFSFAGAALAMWLTFRAVHSLLPAAYESGLDLLPLVALGYLALVVSRAPHNALFLQHRTRAILVCDVVTILAIVLFDLVLIPPAGMLGAGIANAAGFTLSAILKIISSGLWRHVEPRALVVPLRETVSPPEPAESLPPASPVV